MGSSKASLRPEPKFKSASKYGNAGATRKKFFVQEEK